MTSPHKPIARFRVELDDFHVEEIPLYPPAGHGTHLFIRVRKKNATTLACVQRLAKALDVADRDVGYAGMKDRHAVAEQTFSVPFPESREASDLLHLSLEDMEVLDAVRHPHKLRTGHLLENRFKIVLRGLDAESIEGVRRVFSDAQERGVPNEFGPQRFGRDGRNPARALSWLRGEAKPPRDRRVRRLMLSAVQSWLFDQVLHRRMKESSWTTVLEGDLVKKHDTGGLFLCEDAIMDAARAAQREVSATGPIFGAKMRGPLGYPRDLEAEVLGEALDGQVDVALLGGGSRRALRFIPSALRVTTCPEAEGRVAMTVETVLPKGAYATTLLSRACELRDESLSALDASKIRETSRGTELLDDTQPTSEYINAAKRVQEGAPT